MDFPLLYVQYERRLPQKHLVVCGPTYDQEFLRFSDAPMDVAIVDLETGYLRNATVDFSNAHLMSSSEQFGFDPVTTTIPRVRSCQNYNCLIVGPTTDSSVLRTLLLPSGICFRVCDITITLEPSILDIVHEDLVSELHCADTNEKFVYCLEGAVRGYCVVDALSLLSTDRVDAKAIILNDQNVKGAEILVYGLFTEKQSSTKVGDRSKLLIGRSKTYQERPSNGENGTGLKL